MEAPESSVAVAPLRREQYDVLVASGALDEERVELLGGRKVVMTPERAAHAEAIRLLADSFRVHVGAADLHVREAHPVALSDIDEPEPDVALVVDRSYADEHPAPGDLRLLVEVALTSLEKDLGEKAAAYAAAGIADYWVVDLAGRRIVVHRDPGPEGYRAISVVAAGDTVSPLALPEAAIDPAALPG